MKGWNPSVKLHPAVFCYFYIPATTFPLPKRHPAIKSNRCQPIPKEFDYLTERQVRCAILVDEEFSCLEIDMNRDTISWIRKK